MKKEQSNVNRIILPYMGLLLAMCVALQAIIAIRGHKIDHISGLLTVIVALYYVYSQVTTRHKLNKIRFGRLVHHIVAFMIVNLSFHLHAGYLLVSGQKELINEDWYGVLFAMFIFWGFGFLIHLTASVAQRGYEELEV